MSAVEIEQKSYKMPPREGVSIAQFLTVADVERSLRFYERVFGGRILSRGDNSGAPGYIQIANTWLLVNPGAVRHLTNVTLGVPANPDLVSSIMNIRVADIQACYKFWRSRGAEFITEPKPKYGETRCYIRDPDGYYRSWAKQPGCRSRLSSRTCEASGSPRTLRRREVWRTVALAR